MIGSRKKKDTETTKDAAAVNTPVLVGFRAVYVFDVSQTEGAELPQFTERTTGEVGEYRERREIETVIENTDAEPVPACGTAKPAIIVYDKRVGTTISVCTDNHCPIHDPRAAAAQAANPAPKMALRLKPKRKRKPQHVSRSANESRGSTSSSRSAGPRNRGRKTNVKSRSGRQSGPGGKRL